MTAAMTAALWAAGRPADAAPASSISLVTHSAIGPVDPVSADQGPVISASGGVVVFTSKAPNVIPGQINDGTGDNVFLYNNVTGGQTLVSHTVAGTTHAAGSSSLPNWPESGATTEVLTADGSYVVFTSTATNLVPGQIDTAGTPDVFLWQASTGAITLVSHAPGAAKTAVGGATGDAQMDAAGNFVAFPSTAANQVAAQTGMGPGPNLFLWRRATGQVVLISHAAGGATQTADGASTTPVFAATGKVLAFSSQATNLVAGQIDTAGTDDVFTYNLASHTIALASHAAGAPATAVGGVLTNIASGSPGPPAISADGRLVAYVSIATNLVAGQVEPTPRMNVFLYDQAAGTSELVSHTPAGPTTTGDGDTPSISADGRYVTFITSTGIIANPGDNSAAIEDRTTGQITAIVNTSRPTAFSDLAISADGNWIAAIYYPDLDSGHVIKLTLINRAGTVAPTDIAFVRQYLPSTGVLHFYGQLLNTDGSQIAFGIIDDPLAPGQTSSALLNDYVYHRLATAPATTCTVRAVRPGPPAQQDVTVQSTLGLNTITNIQITNGTVAVATYQPGTTGPVVVTATKTDPTKVTTWSFDVLDTAGNVTHCR